jgi:hypothetical protein
LRMLGPSDSKMSRSAYGGCPKRLQHCRLAGKGQGGVGAFEPGSGNAEARRGHFRHG